MLKTLDGISEEAARELLKIQLGRKFLGLKSGAISVLASEFLDKGLGIAKKNENPGK